MVARIEKMLANVSQLIMEVLFHHHQILGKPVGGWTLE